MSIQGETRTVVGQNHTTGASGQSIDTFFDTAVSTPVTNDDFATKRTRIPGRGVAAGRASATQGWSRAIVGRVITGINDARRAITSGKGHTANVSQRTAITGHVDQVVEDGTVVGAGGRAGHPGRNVRHCTSVWPGVTGRGGNIHTNIRGGQESQFYRIIIRINATRNGVVDSGNAVGQHGDIGYHLVHRRQ